MQTVQLSLFPGEDKVFIHPSLGKRPSPGKASSIPEMERALLRFIEKIRKHRRGRMKGIRPSLFNQEAQNVEVYQQHRCFGSLR
jgi:hypothetical protein